MSLMNRTRIYSVYLNPHAGSVADSAQFVSEDFSIPAFLFSWIWLMFHKLWWHSLAVFVAVVLWQQLSHVGWLGTGVAVAGQLVLQLFVGMEAGALRGRALLKRGYVLSDIVAEDSLLHAQQRYFARHASTLA